MASVYLMNGTNEVGMNGTNDFSTNQVGPGRMNGTNSVSLNGTNSVMLNGTNSVTLNGTYVEDLNPYDIELNGVDASDDELDAIRLALAYGDQDVINAYENGQMNGLKDILASRRARIASETPQQREARLAKRKAIFGTVLNLASKIAPIPGASTIGSKLSNLLAKGVDKAKTLQTAVEKAQILTDAGIVPNEVALTTRAAQETDAGLEPPATEEKGIKVWWAARSKSEKALIIGGGVALAGLGVYLLTKKKKRRK